MSMYEELINEGTPIQDLLRGNAGNVGDIGELLELAADEIERLQKTLEEYANPLNWDEDHQGIRRVWLEPESTTPDAYNGFEAARAIFRLY